MGRKYEISLAEPAALAPIAGGSPEADIELGTMGPLVNGAAPVDSERGPIAPEVVLVAVVFATASIVFGVIPQPLFQLAAHAGASLFGIF
jgi:hypothetical protein